jgi:hypothetical protein
MSTRTRAYEYIYSSHETRREARAALERYIASRFILRSEDPAVSRRGSRYCVMVRVWKYEDKNHA